MLTILAELVRSHDDSSNIFYFFATLSLASRIQRQNLLPLRLKYSSFVFACASCFSFSRLFIALLEEALPNIRLASRSLLSLPLLSLCCFLFSFPSLDYGWFRVQAT